MPVDPLHDDRPIRRQLRYSGTALRSAVSLLFLLSTNVGSVRAVRSCRVKRVKTMVPCLFRMLWFSGGERVIYY
jgi:hypothetical protein